MTPSTEQLYDETYFKYQSPMGKIGGIVNVSKFDGYISHTDVVLDFGCGGGYILSRIDCARRLGVEVNPVAQHEARANGLEVYTFLSEVDIESVDVVISNHALEHTRLPFSELQEMHRVLRPNGRVVIVVPCESVFRPYQAADPNHHLFSWSPMCMGNLLLEAGFQDVESRAYIRRAPPKVGSTIARLGGQGLYELSSRVYGWLNPTLSQVRATGVKS